MKLRKAWMLLFLVSFATAAFADTVSPSVPTPGNARPDSTHDRDIRMATTMVAASHTLTQPVVSAGPIIPAPEPATLALFGTGLVGVATLVRFRTRRSPKASERK